MAKLRHLHGVAILTIGMLACATTALAALQLIAPGVFHDAPALGYGRLLLAQYFLAVGVVANALLGLLYDASTRVAAYLERSSVGGWLFAVVNLAVIAPLTFMALAGLLPQSGSLAFLAGLQAPSPWSSILIVMLILQNQASMRSRVAGTNISQPELYFALVIGAMFALIAGHRGEDLRGRLPSVGASLVDGLGTLRIYWQVAMLGTVLVAVVCLVLLHSTVGRRELTASHTPRPRSRWDQIFTVIIVVVLAAWPFAVASDARSNAPAAATTASEAHGREVFIREGCSTCHNSEKRGVGPDLSRESGVRPADWHYAHLFLPALVSPRSPMPSYAHLFDGAPDKPTQEGRDLVAYIDSFGRDKDLAEPAEKAASAHPARARRSTEMPLPSSAASVAPAASVAAGQRLFGTFCINCHGPKGEGNGTAASLLRPRP
ncbi:MAG: cbb3-type cytochrome c oxidase subunit II, partial [Acidobacteria bacterium]|nr:cbb3-type cytochrome c oxidase subunit II [Acidobacteriota bacterium]